MRDIYQENKFRSLDQGMIFNGAVSESYPTRDLLGIIITPRCDISHSKNIYINYLPIVPLHDWLVIDGKTILLEKVSTELIQKLRVEFLKFNISAEIINRNSWIEISSIVKKIVVDEKKTIKMTEALTKLELIDKIRSSTLPSEAIKKFFKEEEKHIRGILKDLSNNRYKEFYLLDPITSPYFNFKNDYHIVLNTEIRKIQLSVALEIATGYEVSKIPEIRRRFNDLNYDYQDELLFFFKQLRSPFIEHLIQIFLSNFNRIGVDDHDANLHNTLLTKIDYNALHIC